MMRYNNIINGLLAIASILAFTACTEDTAYDDNIDAIASKPFIMLLYLIMA